MDCKDLRLLIAANVFAKMGIADCVNLLNAKGGNGTGFVLASKIVGCNASVRIIGRNVKTRFLEYENC